MTDREALLALCHRLGEPGRDLVLLAEGNASMRLAEERMLIKASGCSMQTMGDGDLLEVDRRSILSLLDAGATSDDQTAHAYLASVVTDEPVARMPSVEAILHAVIYDETDASVVAHTHPVAVNSILCSASPGLLVEGSMFPDQIVVLGRRQLLVPYTDPGVPLAAAVRGALRGFHAENGTAPRVIYLVNHGLFVLGSSPAECMRITDMAVKVARILLGTLAAGGPVFLTVDHVDRIDSRLDEHYRRDVLARGSEGI
jgi:rhamnose utilization protein RhaD (predicted bifunctional aldolase and dehydrogenase)